MADARSRIGALVFGAMAAEAVVAAAKLGIADVLGDGQRSTSQIADEIGADRDALTRLLRALAALELLAEPTTMQFRLTETGHLLRSDHPESLHAFVRMFGDPTMLTAWRELETAVRTGETPFDRIFGSGFFDYLSANPQLSELFNTTMRQGTAVAVRQVLRHYDFEPFGTIADIGGGDGTLLAAVLRAYPDKRGILYDSAAGVAAACDTIDAAGVGDRCDIRPGDFRAAAPDGAELYVVKSVLQDWDDDSVVRILSAIRTVIPEAGRLLIIDPVLPDRVDGSAPSTMYLGDLNMLVNLGGRQRTWAEFSSLCESADFALHPAVRLPPPVSLSMLEAKPR